MKYVVITPYDTLPEDNVRPGRVSNLVKHIVPDRDEVVWITSRFSHLHKKFRTRDSSRSEQEFKNTRIIKIDNIAYYKNISIRRLFNHAQFGFSLLFEMRRLIRQFNPDVIICATPPLLAPYFAACIGKIYNIPVVIDIIDLWPEAFGRFIKRKIWKHVLFPPLRGLSKMTIRMASALTGVSDDYTDKFRKYTDGKPVRSFHLGHSVSDFKSEIDPDWSFLAKQSGEPWVTYVGTVSRNYDLVTVMGAARELPGVKFLIVGKGEGFSEITRLVREGMLGNVVLTGEVPYHDLVNLLHRSDVGLVTVNNDAFIRFPYKANDYLVAGLPILTNIRGGEMERVLLEARIGEVYQEMDVSDFVLKLKRLLASSDVEMRERVSRYASEHCDSDRVYQSYLDWVSEIAKAQKHRP